MYEDGISEIEFMNIFADNLKSMIQDRRYTQKELAHDANISEGALSSYLAGKKMIGIRALMNICMVLDCDASEILPYGGMIRVYR